jgi:5-methylcytosine-specific restriction endonuclease McrA
MKHSDYIKTTDWKQLRALILERDAYICQDCKRNTATEVHHLHYKNYMREAMSDLISLCRICHGKRHGKKKTILPVRKKDFVDGIFETYEDMVTNEIKRINKKEQL